MASPKKRRRYKTKKPTTSNENKLFFPPSFTEEEDILGEDPIPPELIGIEEEFKDWPEGHDLRKYPSPKSNIIFKKIWRDFIESVVGRDNFKQGHLHQLEILCDLYVERHNLEKFIAKHGYTYLSKGRNGDQFKTWPEVAQMNRVNSEIRSYSKMLDIVLKKDNSLKNDNEGQTWD